MAMEIEPAYWCHQCGRQTWPVIGRDVLCTFCNGGFVEEMENAGSEPEEHYSGSSFGLPVSVSNGGIGTGVRGGVPQEESQRQGQARPWLVFGQHPGISQLLEVRTDATTPLPNPADTGGQEQRDVQGRSAPTFPGPVNRVVIIQGDIPNFLGGLGNHDAFVDNELGAGQAGHYFLGPELDRLIQLLAENDPDSYGTPPASKAAVEGMPTMTITEEQLKIDAIQCAVCKDDFEIGVEVRQMPCKHLYHADCILPWLTYHSSCPVCRYKMPTEDLDHDGRRSQTDAESSSGLGQIIANGHSRGIAEDMDNGALRAQGRHRRFRITRRITLLGMPGSGLNFGSNSSSPVDSSLSADMVAPQTDSTEYVPMEDGSGSNASDTGTN
eukprot:c23971_g2_i1 orf=675-1820(-)